jgi:cytochrome c oxidase cbb3-type subunit 3
MAHPEHHDYDGITEDREQRPPVYFNVLFYGLIVWGVAFSAYYLLSGWSSADEFQAKMQAHEESYQTSAAPPAQAPPPAEPPPAHNVAAAPVTSTAAPDAAALYAEKCAMCHGADGKGGFGPDLSAPANQFDYGKSREGLYLSIAQGRGNGKMPSYEGQLRREEIYALVDYILALK